MNPIYMIRISSSAEVNSRIKPNHVNRKCLRILQSLSHNESYFVYSALVKLPYYLCIIFPKASALLYSLLDSFGFSLFSNLIAIFETCNNKIFLEKITTFEAIDTLSTNSLLTNTQIRWSAAQAVSSGY